MRTKKIVSLFAAFAMIATMISSFTVASAEGAPAMTNTITKMSNDDFLAVMGDNIPAGYDAYSVVTGLSNLGTLSATKVGLNINGTRLGSAGITVTFDDVSKVNTDWSGTVDGVVSPSSGFSGAQYTGGFVGDAKTAYPSTSGETIEDAIDTVLYTVFVIESGAEVTATISGIAKINTYSGGKIVTGTDKAYGPGQVLGDLSYDKTSYTFGQEEPPAVVAPTVEITATEGEDSSAGAWTFYYTTVVTKGTAAIEYAGVEVTTGPRAQIGYLSDALLANIEGDFTFYIGNKSDNADTTYTATATVTAGDDTVTDTATYTTPNA